MGTKEYVGRGAKYVEFTNVTVQAGEKFSWTFTTISAFDIIDFVEDSESTAVVKYMLPSGDVAATDTLVTGIPVDVGGYDIIKVEITNTGATRQFNGFITAYELDVNSNLQDIGTLTPTSNYFIVGTGSTWATKSPSQVSTILGLGGYVPYTGAISDVNLGLNGLIAHRLQSDASDGLLIEAGNGTDVGIFGVGNTANVTWYGSHNFSSQTADTLAYFGASKTLSSATLSGLTLSSGTLSVNSAALTKIDDTNVTLTLGGSHTTALLNATSLTLGWTGQLSVSRGGTGASSFASGSIPFSTGTILTQDNANLYWDDTNNWLGIGTNSPLGVQHLSSDAVTTQYIDSYSSSLAGTRIRFRRALGTKASPSSIVDPDTDLGAFYFDAYMSGSFYGVAGVACFGDGSPSVSSIPTQLSFLTTTVGATNATVKLTLSNDGKLGIGNFYPINSLDVSGGAAIGSGFAGVSSVSSNSLAIQENLSIGTTSALGRVYVVDESATPGRLYFDQYRSSSGVYSGMTMRKARGTFASPSNVINGDTLGAIEFYGYAGSFVPGAIISAVVDSITGTNDLPTSLVFRTTADGAAVTTEAGRFTSNQTLNLGSTVPAINTMVSGTSLIQTNVRFITGYSASAGVNNYFMGSGNDGGLLQVFGCSNTLASPTAITTDGRLGGFFGRGYAATGYSNAVTAIQYYAEATFTDTSTPTYITFSTTASGAITRREILRINSAGALLFADGYADGIGFRGSLGNYSIQYYNDGSRYPLRFVGASDAVTPRWFEFGNYTSDTYGGTWNAKVSINSVTAYTTIGTVATGPWPVSTTYALFGNTALDQTNAGNYSIVVSAGGELNLNRPTSQNIYMRENNGATSQLTVLTGGKVGINVNSPANYLDAWNNANSAVYNEVARFVVTNNSFGTNYSRLNIGQNATNVMFLEAANQSNTKGNLLLQPFGGFVGVGVTSALSIFHVQGPANDWTARFTGSSTTGQSFGPVITAGSNSSDTSLQVLDKTATTTYMRILGNGNTGINTASAAWRFVVNENAGYSSRAANPLPAQVAIQSGATGYLKMGNYYTGGVGTCSTIQSTDFYSGADHGVNLLLNPLGGNVGVGELDPNFPIVARYTGTIAQISARYNGTVPSDYKELQIGYNGTTGNGYGWIQAVANGIAYTPLSLNPNGGNVGVSTTGPLAKFHVLETSGADDVIFQRSGSGGTSDSIKIANDGTVSTITGDNEEFKINHSVGTYQYFKGGNVGIGTTNPLAKLDVVGTLRIGNDAWHTSQDGKSRFYLATNDRTYFGSQNGYEFRSAADAGIFFISNSGDFNTINSTTLNAYTASGVSGSYVQLGNSSAGGYSTQLIHSAIHTILQNGAGGILYLRTYTANYAAIVGEVNMGQEGALYIKNRASVPGTPSGGGYLYTESGALKYKGSSGTVTTIAAA